MSDCLFCKIIAGDIPSTKVYEDDLVFAFQMCIRDSLRRKSGSYSHNGINDKSDRGTAEPYGLSLIHIFLLIR